MSFASMPFTMVELGDHLCTSVAMLESMPSDATVGVSVFPSSVMSGPFLPLLNAVVQSVVRFPHGTKTTWTLVLA